jgi:MFS family permease
LLALYFGGYWISGLNSLQTPLAKGVLGTSDTEFGWFQAIWGVGLGVASALVGWYGMLFHRGRLIVVAQLLWAVATAAMGLSANLGMLSVAGFWVGFSNIVFLANVSTLVMEQSSADRVGRTVSVYQVAQAFMRVSSLLLFGWLADKTSVRVAIVSMAATSFGGVLVATVRFPGLWRLPFLAEAPAWRDGKIGSVGRGLSDVLRQSLERYVASEFSIPEQRWLNGAALAVLGVSWVALFARQPLPAVATAGVAIATLWAALTLRMVARRVRHQRSGGDHESR